MDVQTVVLDGKRYVLIPEEEYSRLAAGSPALPQADVGGNRPAVAFAKSAIARSIVRDRERGGLTQGELAVAAGVPLAALDRFERGVDVPSSRALAKIESALAGRGVARRTPAHVEAARALGHSVLSTRASSPSNPPAVVPRVGPAKPEPLAKSEETAARSRAKARRS